MCVKFAFPGLSATGSAHTPRANTHGLSSRPAVASDTSPSVHSDDLLAIRARPRTITTGVFLFFATFVPRAARSCVGTLLLAMRNTHVSIPRNAVSRPGAAIVRGGHRECFPTAVRQRPTRRAARRARRKPRGRARTKRAAARARGFSCDVRPNTEGHPRARSRAEHRGFPSSTLKLHARAARRLLRPDALQLRSLAAGLPTETRSAPLRGSRRGCPPRRTKIVVNHGVADRVSGERLERSTFSPPGPPTIWTVAGGPGDETVKPRFPTRVSRAGKPRRRRVARTAFDFARRTTRPTGRPPARRAARARRTPPRSRVHARRGVSPGCERFSVHRRLQPSSGSSPHWTSRAHEPRHAAVVSAARLSRWPRPLARSRCPSRRPRAGAAGETARASQRAGRGGRGGGGRGRGNGFRVT